MTPLVRSLRFGEYLSSGLLRQESDPSDKEEQQLWRHLVNEESDNGLFSPDQGRVDNQECARVFQTSSPKTVGAR